MKSMHEVAITSLRWLSIAIGMLLIVFALFLLSHSFYIGFMAPASVVSEYYFGAEAMISNGGWGYKSRELYFWSGAYKSAYFLIPGLLVLLAALKVARLSSGSAESSDLLE